MISRLLGAVLSLTYRRRYTGRHRFSYPPQRKAVTAAATSTTVVALEATT